MIENETVGVVIPCYNEEHQIAKVIDTIPDFVDYIICIDDNSSDNTYCKLLEIKAQNSKLTTLKLEKNEGVGGAIDAGYGEALRKKIDWTAVMGGDGQMNPLELRGLIEALRETGRDYAKINRLFDSDQLHQIPRIRLFGNSILSGLTRLSTGYWTLADSQTGYTVISFRALKSIQGNLWKKYGVPNDILNKLSANEFQVVEIPSLPIYGVGEVSKLQPRKVMLPILKLQISAIKKRIFTKYLVRTLHPIGLGYFLSVTSTVSALAYFFYLVVFVEFRLHVPITQRLILDLVILQIAFILFWLSMIFDAIINKDNIITLRNKYVE